MFFIAQQSPRCGDGARLFAFGGQSSSVPPSPMASDAVPASIEMIRGIGNIRTKKLNLKGFLPAPKRSDAEKEVNHWPSADGLLAVPSNEESLGMDDNVSYANSNAYEDKSIYEGQFFTTPATPTMDFYPQISINKKFNKKGSAFINQVMNIGHGTDDADDSSGVAAGFGSAKKTKNLLQRIKRTPLRGRKKKQTIAFGSLHDDPLDLCEDK